MSVLFLLSDIEGHEKKTSQIVLHDFDLFLKCLFCIIYVYFDLIYQSIKLYLKKTI